MVFAPLDGWAGEHQPQVWIPQDERKVTGHSQLCVSRPQVGFLLHTADLPRVGQRRPAGQGTASTVYLPSFSRRNSRNSSPASPGSSSGRAFCLALRSNSSSASRSGRAVARCTCNPPPLETQRADRATSPGRGGEHFGKFVAGPLRSLNFPEGRVAGEQNEKQGQDQGYSQAIRDARTSISTFAPDRTTPPALAFAGSSPEVLN